MLKYWKKSILPFFILCLFLLMAQSASADILDSMKTAFIDEFQYKNGKTHWQHVANWSGGILIILLFLFAIRLFFIHREAKNANLALKEIKNVLEQRVFERTALLRSSESYIKNILESMPLMLVGLNKEMEVTQWNKQAEVISGKSAEQALGKKLWEAYPTITVSPEQISKVQKDNSPVTIKHSQRGQCYYDISIYPLTEQIETGIVILIDNVTQRILAENMLIQRDKMSSMGELASTMAHDIGVPMQEILTDLKTVQLSLSGIFSAQEKMVTDIQQLLYSSELRGKQISGVINNLLEFAHSQGDRKHLSDITEIIEHAVTLAKDILIEPTGLRFSDIVIERHYQENLPTIPCNVAELHQVFFSLFRHAFKFLGQVKAQVNFTPTIRIDLVEAYDALWIKIHHNGAGLTNEEQQYIFEPFFNKTSNTSTGDENSEIGKRLSFTYFIISEHHNGELAVTSDFNTGTTFHIQLQLK